MSVRNARRPRSRSFRQDRIQASECASGTKLLTEQLRGSANSTSAGDGATGTFCAYQYPGEQDLTLPIKRARPIYELHEVVKGVVCHALIIGTYAAKPLSRSTSKKPGPVVFSLQALRALEALRRQREALALGRAKGNAERHRKAQELRMLIVDLAAADMQKGKPTRGRAGRVHRKLPLRPDGKRIVGERLVRKIFSAMQNESGRFAGA